MYRANKNISNYIKIVIQVLQYFFVLLFVYAAVSKLLDFETFRVQLAQSPLLSAYAGILAWAVPVAELVIAGLLCFEPTKKLGVGGFFFMMVMFSAYIFFILKFADFVPCSCGGVLEKMSWGQHLIFNLFFVALSGIILYFGLRGKRSRRWMVLGTQFILGIGVVAILFAFSERKMQRNNAFQRRYVPHPVEKVNSFDLKFNSYYFAGAGDGKVYLGNTTAPLLMTVIDAQLQDTVTTMIRLDQMDLPFRAVKIQVIPPHFFVSDGTVPIVFKGNILDWEATTVMHGDYYFNHFLAVDKHAAAVQSNSSKNRENIIGILEFKDKTKGIFSLNILEKQIDGIFDTDGHLLYNKNTDRLVFVYYYRNQYIGINKNLEVIFRGNTIDTISKAQVHLAENISKEQRKLGGNTVMVNRATATFGNFLLVDSPRLGKMEPKDMMREASIIDVYHLPDQTYRFSFYLYRHEKEKTRSFMVSEGILYALQGNYLTANKIQSDLFGSNNISAQRQGED